MQWSQSVNKLKDGDIIGGTGAVIDAGKDAVKGAVTLSKDALKLPAMVVGKALFAAAMSQVMPMVI